MTDKLLRKAGYTSEEGSMDYELKITKEQTKFNEWFYSKFKPYLNGDILEVGSGIGTFSEKIIKDFGGEIYLTEIDPIFLKELKKQFKEKRVRVKKLDLNNKKDFEKINKKFDSILCSNVLEHIKNDALALKLFKQILKPGGRIIIYVPCHKFLFCDLDTAEGHYRRYTKKELEEKAKITGFKIRKASWFNFFGIPTRFLVGNIMKAKKTPANSFRLYNQMIPIFRFIEEKILFNCAGVGRIVVLEKT